MSPRIEQVGASSPSGATPHGDVRLMADRGLRHPACVRSPDLSKRKQTARILRADLPVGTQTLGLSETPSSMTAGASSPPLRSRLLDGGSRRRLAESEHPHPTPSEGSTND